MSSKQAQISNLGTAERDLLNVANALDDSSFPDAHEDRAFVRNRKSLHTIIPAEARKDADIDLHDPDPVTHYYFTDSKVLLIDLGGRFSNE